MPRLAHVRRVARRHRDRALLTTYRAVIEFVEDRGHRDAAQIAFFVILSFVPLALLLVGAFGLVFDDSQVRDRVIETVFDNVPLTEGGARPRLERTVREALDGAGSLGFVSVLVLIVGASNVMGALRHAINQAWDIDRRPSLLRRKALDISLVLGATIVLVLSLSLTAAHRAADVLDRQAGGWPVALALDALAGLLPFAFTAGVVAFLYRVLPVRRPTVREVWPGALVAAVGLTVVKLALELYFAQLSDFGALYGSLGALMALLVFVYASANVLVFGAEFASEWARLPPDVVVRAMVRAGRRRVAGRLRR